MLWLGEARPGMLLLVGLLSGVAPIGCSAGVGRVGRPVDEVAADWPGVTCRSEARNNS